MVNTLKPRQNGRHFADDIFKCIFLNENVWIPIKISMKFVPKGPINNIPALVQIMAWRRPGDKPLFEPMMISLQTHICVTRPQWVKECLISIIKGFRPNFNCMHPCFVCICNSNYYNGPLTIYCTRSWMSRLMAWAKEHRQCYSQRGDEQRDITHIPVNIFRGNLRDTHMVLTFFKPLAQENVDVILNW